MISLQYVGGLAVHLKLPSGRLLEVSPGDVVELFEVDYDALSIRSDWVDVSEPTLTLFDED